MSKKKKTKGTSPTVAADAARQLSDPTSSSKEKEVAGSDLSQATQKKGKKRKK